jgi:hypothetical protein
VEVGEAVRILDGKVAIVERHTLRNERESGLDPVHDRSHAHAQPVDSQAVCQFVRRQIAYDHRGSGSASLSRWNSASAASIAA